MTKIGKFFLNIKDKFSFSKRQQFVGVTLILTLGLMFTQMFSGNLRFDLMLVFAIITYFFSALVLRQDLSRWEWLTLLILPAFYSAAIFLFYFLLPTRWLTRIPIAILYSIGMYAILLTENIYNVAAQRNIQLLRAAHSVGFLLSLVTVFLLSEILISLHLPYYLNSLFTLCIIFPLTLQALWSIELTENISALSWWGSVVVSVICVGLVGVFSFWPIPVTIEALFVTTVFYSLIGIIQQHLVGRLFENTLREYLLILILGLILIIFTTHWGSRI